MTPFEAELKRALARREPSEDFSARVLARTQEKKVGQTIAFRLPGRLLTWALAAALLLALGGGVAYQRHERAVRGQTAKRQLLLAMQIAGSKLHYARQQVMQVEGMEIE
ncbi:MAG TPA: hypothetical protein VF283_03560 [Bryobacteraceae bacterium]